MYQTSNQPTAFVGCAGWNIPKGHADRFPPAGSHLERYAQVFQGVEINSSFYRPHKPSTYERWAASVPPTFRFAVKVPRTITHFRRLKGVEDELATFLAECANLGSKLGPLLVQLPPSLAFDLEVAAAFFDRLRSGYDGPVACEPRHPTWFGADPNEFLSKFHIARVAADPAIVPDAAEPEGTPDLVYYRLHGSPRIYYSAYSDQYLTVLAEKLATTSAGGSEVWCIFDNTAEGEATGDALAVVDRLDRLRD